MPTEPHDTPDQDLRSRFHELGEHLERSLDAPSDIAQVPLGRVRRVPATRGLFISAAAALVVVVLAGAWLAGRSSDGNDRVVASSDSPSDSQPDENATPSSDDPWPPPAEVHEHCVEDEATRGLYAEGDYPSEATRAQHCEARFHDLPQLVVTPEGVSQGVVSSAALRDQTASDEFQALLEGQGFDANDVAIQSAYQELWGAISNRHAVPVFDRDGEQIGWFGGGYEPDQGGFVSMEDMPKVRAEAERVIAEFERIGALPGSSPRIESLKATFAETAECLEAEGFFVNGPFPASDGRGLMYEVGSPQGGPWLAMDNACESPFNALARDFALSAPLEDRLSLVEEFNRVLACVDPTAEPSPTMASRVEYLERDVEAEGTIQIALRVWPDATEHPCLGAG